MDWQNNIIDPFNSRLKIFLFKNIFDMEIDFSELVRKYRKLNKCLAL